MQKSEKFQIGNVITISTAHLVHDVYSSFLAPLLPLLIEKLSISYTMAGILTIIQRIPSLFNPATYRDDLDTNGDGVINGIDLNELIPTLFGPSRA